MSDEGVPELMMLLLMLSSRVVLLLEVGGDSEEGRRIGAEMGGEEEEEEEEEGGEVVLLLPVSMGGRDPSWIRLWLRGGARTEETCERSGMRGVTCRRGEGAGKGGAS